MASSKITTDHEEIKAWVEKRGGIPAAVKRAEGEGDLGILRIDFPGFSGEDSLEHVEWDDWFEAFDDNELVFLHQEQTQDGEQSRFNKLISRDRATSRERA